MSWVTKSSTEQYQAAPPPPELTPRQKMDNWWHYHWLYVVAAIAGALIAGSIIKDTVFRPRPDYQVGVVSRYELPVDTANALTEALTGFGEDLNGDGKVLVQLNQYTVDFHSEETNADAYSQMAGVTRLSADLQSGGGTYVFLMEDPAGFEEQTGALQYLDGTVGDPDAPPADWENMVYRWEDCPALTALELGEYQGQTLMDDSTGSSQEYLKQFYVGRRGVWDPRQAEKFAGCADFWNALTAGAAPMEGQP